MTIMIIEHSTDEDLMTEVFAEIITSLGYEAWWACEEIWDTVAEIMIEMGFDKEMVADYFSEMCWEL